jgi:hypothetical protein
MEYECGRQPGKTGIGARPGLGMFNLRLGQQCNTRFSTKTLKMVPALGYHVVSEGEACGICDE